MHKYYVNIFAKRFYRDIEFMLFIHFFLPTFKAYFILLLKLKYIYIYSAVFLKILSISIKINISIVCTYQKVTIFQYLPGLIEQAVSSIVQMSHTVHCYAVERSFNISLMNIAFVCVAKDSHMQ